MTAPAAFKATFADFRLIKGRKVAQLIVEVPLEEADNALAALGGLPRPDVDRWVAVARLNGSPGAPIPGSEVEVPIAGPPEVTDGPRVAPRSTQADGPTPGETHGGWYALKPSARAALLCKDENFRIWINRNWKMGVPVDTEEEINEWLKGKTDTPEKKRLNPDHEHHRPDSLRSFLRIERQYRQARGLETEDR